MHNDNVVTEVALAKSKKLLETTTAQLHQKEREVSDLQQQHTDLNDTIHALVEENKAIQETIKQMEEELKGIDNDLYTSEQHGSSSLIPPLGSSSFADFSVQTTCGKRYSNGVRELYYQLLSMHIPPAKIADIPFSRHLYPLLM